jgi:hypothetical protein
MALLDNINYYTILYIIIIVICVIIVIGFVIYLIKRKSYMVPDIPQKYTVGKYGHLKYVQV